MKNVDEAYASAPWLRGRWVRRGYHIQGGHIRPVPGSEVREYGPRDNYRDEEGRLERRSLVDDLLRLDCLEEDGDDSRLNFTTILRFVNRWGLLGLFQERLLMRFYVPAYPEQQGIGFAFVCEGPDFSPQGRGAHRLPRLPDGAIDGARRRQRFEKRFPAADRLGVAHVKSVSPGGITETGLEYFSDLFFPGRRDGGGLPSADDPALLPLRSPELWDHLSEPVWDFWEAVDEFKRVAQEIAELRGEPSGTTLPSERLQSKFSWHLSRVHPALATDPAPTGGSRAGRGRAPDQPLPWKARMVWPSLLSAAYWLLLESVTGGYTPRACANATCRVLFMPDRPDQEYCSKSCRNAQTQRRHRQRQKTARAQPASSPESSVVAQET